ncbi:MAG: DUF58 domain-containing protein [Rhodothermales bacterium]
MIPKELFKKIRRIEIRTKGLVNNVFGGEYHSAFKGRGIEFSEVRPYYIGDDIRSIDWNVSARTGEAHVKVFEEEREQTLMLVVDVSGSGDFGSQSKFKREIAAEICAVIAFSAISNNDKVGLLLVSDRIELFVPPKKGRRHALRLLRDLFAHEPASRGTDLSVALNHILHVLNRKSIVLLISDFFDSGFLKPLRVVARRHDAIAVHLIDPREEELPPMGLLDLTDAETGETIVIDTSDRRTRRTFAMHAGARQADIADLFTRIRMDYVPIRTDVSYVEPLIQFFRQRNKASR